MHSQNQRHSPKQRSEDELRVGLPARVDLTRAFLVQQLKERGTSPTRAAAYLAHYDERARDRAQAIQLHKDDELAIRALAHYAGMVVTDTKNIIELLWDSSDSCLTRAIRDLFNTRNAKEPVTIAQCRELYHKVRTAREAVVSHPLTVAILSSSPSIEQLTAALAHCGARSRLNVDDFKGDFAEALGDDAGATITMEREGYDRAEQFIDYMIDARESLMNGSFALNEAVLTSLERLFALRVPDLEKRFIADVKEVATAALEADDSSQKNRFLSDILVCERLSAKNSGGKVDSSHVYLMRWCPDYVDSVIDAYALLQKEKAVPIFLAYRPGAETSLFQATAIANRIVALKEQHIDLGLVLELFRSAPDGSQLELLEVVQHHPRILDLYKIAPQGMKRQAFTEAMLSLSRLGQFGEGLNVSQAPLDRFLEIATAGERDDTLTPLIHQCAPLVTHELFDVISTLPVQAAPVQATVRRDCLAILATCLERSSPNRLRLLASICNDPSVASGPNFGSILRSLSTKSEGELAGCNDLHSLTSVSFKRPPQQKGAGRGPGERKSPEKPARESLMERLAGAVGQGLHPGITPQMFSDAAKTFDRGMITSLAYVHSRHSQAFPALIRICAKSAEAGKMLLGDAELLAGLCRAVETSGADAVVSTVQEVFCSDIGNPYFALRRWLGALGTCEVSTGTAFSLSGQQLLAEPLVKRQYRKIFFIGGQHSRENQEAIRQVVAESVDLRFYHGLEKLPLDLTALDGQTIVICLTKSNSHAVHDRVKRAAARAGSQFCYFHKSGCESTKVFVSELLYGTPTGQLPTSEFR